MTYVTTRKEYWDCWQSNYKAHEDAVKTLATLLNSDGCTGVPEFYRLSCLEHDIAYRTGMGCHGEVISRAEADRRMRWHVQMKSPFGRFSPLSWWRWTGVRIGGRRAWLKDQKAADRTKPDSTLPGSVEA